MNYIITRQLKNTGIAVFLTVLFGGIGLFYSSILGGIIMTVLFPLLVFLLFFSGHFILSILLACLYYIICFIWAIISVNRYNKNILSTAKLEESTIPSPSKKSEGSENENYYHQYRKSLDSDNTILWLTILVVMCSVIFYMVFHFGLHQI